MQRRDFLKACTLASTFGIVSTTQQENANSEESLIYLNEPAIDAGDKPLRTQLMDLLHRPGFIDCLTSFQQAGNEYKFRSGFTLDDQVADMLAKLRGYFQPIANAVGTIVVSDTYNLLQKRYNISRDYVPRENETNYSKEYSWSIYGQGFRQQFIDYSLYDASGWKYVVEDICLNQDHIMMLVDKEVQIKYMRNANPAKSKYLYVPATLKSAIMRKPIKFRYSIWQDCGTQTQMCLDVNFERNVNE